MNGLGIPYALALFAASAPIAAVSENLLSNSGFETGFESWVTNTKAADSVSFTFPTTGCHSGSACLKVVHLGTRDWAVAPSSPPTAVKPGQVWTFSAWARLDSLPGSLSLSFLARDSAGTVLDWTYAQVSFPRTDTGWIQKAAVISVPAGCATIQPRVTGWAQGSMRLDVCERMSVAGALVRDRQHLLADQPGQHLGV